MILGDFNASDSSWTVGLVMYRLYHGLPTLIKKFVRRNQMAIQNYVKGNNLSSMEQNSFGKGLSCLTNLITTREDWIAEKDRNIPVDVVS